MQSFKDSDGNDWHVKVNVRTYRELKNSLDLDLMSFDTEMNDRIMDDPSLIADILYICCEDQAKSRNITDIQFGEGLTGNSLRDGVNAFLEGIVNFTQNPKRQEALRKMLKLIMEGEDMILDEVLKGINAVTLKELGTRSSP